MIISVIRKSPSGCRMETGKEGSQHGSRKIRWKSFTVQAKEGLAFLRVVLEVEKRGKANTLGGRSKEIWIRRVG